MVDVVELRELRILLADQIAIGCAFRINGNARPCFEGRLQAAKSFKRRLGTRELFMVESDRAIIIVNGDERLVETTFFNGLGRTLLREESKLVHRLTVNAFKRRNSVGADALLR